MNTLRVCFLLIAIASFVVAETPGAIVITQPRTLLTPDAAIIAVGRVDGHVVDFRKSQIVLPPGRHTFYLLIKNARGRRYDTQELGYTLEGKHRYSFVGRFYPKETVRLQLADENRPGVYLRPEAPHK